MATLFNTKISATYEGLLKTIDNAAITATLRELTDGSGNQSGLYLNTAGDFKVTSILEWGSLKDTGTGVTITQFVTAANGIENFNNDTTIPTSAAVKLYVDSKPGESLTQVLGFGNTTSGIDIAVSSGDDITFTDTSKILMGAGSDLQIYHDGSNSYVKDTGTGRLWLDSNGEGVSIISDGSEATPMAHFYKDAAVELYYNNVKKFETTSLGSTVTGDLLVTGTITASGGSFLPLSGGTMTGNIVLNDNVKTVYGTASDFEIFHNASSNTNLIQSNSSRQLILAQDNIFIGNQLASEPMITAVADGAVSLYFNNSKKLETTTAGVTITGDLLINTTGGYFEVDKAENRVKFADNTKATFGTGQELEIFHDGSNSKIVDVGTGDLRLAGNVVRIRNAADTENMVSAVQGGAVSLAFNNTTRLETVTAGAKVTGNLEVTGTITGAGGSFLPLAGGTMTGNTIHNDNVKSI